MKGLEFPIISTRVKGLNKKFDLSSPEGRKAYFEAKAGDEVTRIKKYLDKNTFVAYMIGKKNSGKGTYSQIFTEIFGADKIALVSVGDIIRNITADWENFKKSDKYKKLQKIYRGYISFEEACNALIGRTTSKLLPTELILALLKLEIEKLKGKSIFIDGLPREDDQISYALYFRDLIDYRADPDIFVLIDIPESVINERIKYRVVCPECKNSRNTKLFISSKIEYSEQENTYYLLCDSPRCKGGFRMIPKEGDNLGITPIKDRLDKDEAMVRQVFALHGVPKVLMRNHIPIKESKTLFDEYEITPEYSFTHKGTKVIVHEKPWQVKDDNGDVVVSMLAAPVVVTMLKQLPEALGI